MLKQLIDMLHNFSYIIKAGILFQEIGLVEMDPWYFEFKCLGYRTKATTTKSYFCNTTLRTMWNTDFLPVGQWYRNSDQQRTTTAFRISLAKYISGRDCNNVKNMSNWSRNRSELCSVTSFKATSTLFQKQLLYRIFSNSKT